MDFEMGSNALNNEDADAQQDTLGCDEELEQFQMDLQNDEDTGFSLYSSSSPLPNVLAATTTSYDIPGFYDNTNTIDNTQISNSYSSNSQHTVSSQCPASSWTSDQSSIPSRHFGDSDPASLHEKPDQATSFPGPQFWPAVAPTSVADVQFNSTPQPRSMSYNGRQYYDDTVTLSRTHDRDGSTIEPEIPTTPIRASLLTQAFQRQRQHRLLHSSLRDLHRGRPGARIRRDQQIRSHPMQVIGPMPASSAPPSRVYQGMHMILEGWLKRTTAQGRARTPPQGRELEALVIATNATPAYIHAWFVRRLNCVEDGLDTGLQSFAPSFSAHGHVELTQSITNTNPEDVRDVEQLIRDRQARSCSTKHPYPLHTKPFSCGKCGAGAKDFTEWRRHQESVFPLKFFRCRICNKIETRHVPDHTVKVHGTDPALASYQIPYNPYWSGSCQYCGEVFEGLRTNTWKRMLDHVWKQHISKHPVKNPRCNLPVVTNTEDDDKDGDDLRDRSLRPPQGAQVFKRNSTQFTFGVNGSCYRPSEGAMSVTSDNNNTCHTDWDDSVSSVDTDLSDSSDDEELFRGRALQRRALPSDTILTDSLDEPTTWTADPDISMWGIGSAEPMSSHDYHPSAYVPRTIDISEITQNSDKNAVLLQDYEFEPVFPDDDCDDQISGRSELDATPPRNLMLCHPMKHRTSIDDLRSLEWYYKPDQSNRNALSSKRLRYATSDHAEVGDEVIYLHEIAARDAQSACPVISPLQASFTDKQLKYLNSNANFIVHLGKGVAFHHMPLESETKTRQVTLMDQTLKLLPSTAVTISQICSDVVTASIGPGRISTERLLLDYPSDRLI